MVSKNSNNQQVGTAKQRVGFWLGLILFMVLMAMPTPRSMREAVRERFADQIKVDVARALAQDDQTGDALPEAVATDSEAYRRTQARVVEDRARVMLAAAAVTALVACWWISVALPIPVTSLLPLLLFPVVGVLPIKAVAVPYANPNVFLFMGGFIIALGLQRWGLHRRIALHIVRLIGTSRSTIVLGFMLASAFLSMWISNTATTLMMLPIGMAIISAVSELGVSGDDKRDRNFANALMLGIAYAASIGGVATPIGTPPNISFRGQFAQLFPAAEEISFGHWMMVFVPLVVVFLPIAWLVLVRVTCRVGTGRLPVGRQVVREELRGLGPMGWPEKVMLVIFGITALLWMTRSIPIGGSNYGWSAILETLLAPADGAAYLFQSKYINDTTVALFMALLLFIIPARRDQRGRREYLMDWETAQRLPWGVLLLFGGGFAIAAGFSASGLSFWCGKVFAASGITNPVVVVGGTCLMMTFVTEITSNTATTEVMLPILARASLAIEANPLLLMLPAAISASCAFMLPVATPPNAIVFGSGQVDMGRMVRSGIILNFVGVVLVTATFYLVAKPVLGIDLSVLPAWAR